MAKAVRKIAKSVVKGQAETKFASALLENDIVHNSAISSADLLPILPPINSGEEDYQKTGDTIRPTKLVVRGLVSQDRNYANDNRVLLVRIVILSAKATKNQVATTSLFGTYASELLKPNQVQPGPVTVQVKSFQGQQNDLYYPINRDAFIVHYDRVHRIACCQTGDNRSVEENPSGYFSWRKTIKLPKKLTYDTQQNVPNNFCPFYGIGYAYADGTAPDTVTTRIVSNLTSTLYYKDM